MQIKWSVTSMDCRVQEEQYQDVVFCVHFDCTGTDVINGKEYSGRVYSTCNVPAPEGSFINYNDLTQDVVLDWIWANGIDRAATEAAVEAQIQAQANPVTVTPPLPWLPQAA